MNSCSSSAIWHGILYIVKGWGLDKAQADPVIVDNQCNMHDTDFGHYARMGERGEKMQRASSIPTASGSSWGSCGIGGGQGLAAAIADCT